MKRQRLGILTISLVAGMALCGFAATDTSSDAAPPVGAPPPPPTMPAAPDGSKLSGPAHEVEKLVHAGMPDDVIKAYIANSQTTFNLTPDNLVHLQSQGVSSAVMAAMLAHDGTIQANAAAYAQTVNPGAQPTEPPPTTAPDTGGGYATTAPAPDTTQYAQPAVDDGSWYYNNGYGWYYQPYYSYYPYGGYGWCWFPATGWCWYPISHFGFGFNRGFGRGFDRGFGRGFNGGFGRGFNGGFNRGFNGTIGNHFAGNAGNRFGGVHSFGATRSFAAPSRSFGGGSMGRSFGGGGFSGGHSGGFGGGFGGGHGGGGMGGGHR